MIEHRPDPEDPQDKLNHPSFPQPEDTYTSVWRYFDLAKFVWLLENKKLYLTRLDCLSDPHEGSTPRIVAESRENFIRKFGDETMLETVARYSTEVRTNTYVNCWRTGDEESEAMWRLYCPNDNGVAIQTTYQKLVDSIYDSELYIGLIRYIDYDAGAFDGPYQNILDQAMYKRRSFAHEAEVRLVWAMYRDETSQQPPGLTVDWPLETIERIFVNPYAPEYFYDVVCAIVRSFEPSLEDLVVWSNMRSAPLY